MTQENRETIQRALGFLEVVSYVAGGMVQDAILLAVDMISVVLDKEERENGT